jgi:catalase
MLTEWFGVTLSGSERNLAREPADIKEITERSLLMQSNAAAKQHRSLARGTHAKGVCAQAQFEVFDLATGRDPRLAARLAKGIFAKPGVYRATVRFGNSDSNKNSDFKADVRSLSFSVEAKAGRQDFTLQNAPFLPINDSPAFVAIVKVLTASSPAAGLWSLEFKDKLRVMRVLALLQGQAHQTVKPYQQLRYWSMTPFRHGPVDFVKYSVTPSPDNPAAPLKKSNPNGLKDELIRHVQEDNRMSAFDFGVQFLDPARMTYRGKHLDASFWIENASVNWNEHQAPFHTIARLTLLSKSHLSPEASAAVYFDVTGNSTPDSTPVGSINRARQPAEVASRKARMGAESKAPSTLPSNNVPSETLAHARENAHG